MRLGRWQGPQIMGALKDRRAVGRGMRLGKWQGPHIMGALKDRRATGR